MLHLLCEGLRDSADYRIYQKRHVLEMAISYHDSHLSDTRSQVGVEKKRSARIWKISILGAGFEFGLEGFADS